MRHLKRGVAESDVHFRLVILIVPQRRIGVTAEEKTSERNQVEGGHVSHEEPSDRGWWCGPGQKQCRGEFVEGIVEIRN